MQVVGCSTLYIVISIWSKEELPEVLKDLFNVLIKVKGNETDCNNYRGI